MSTFVPPKEFIVHETEHWLVNHRVDSALSGYLMVGAKAPASNIAYLAEDAQREAS